MVAGAAACVGAWAAGVEDEAWTGRGNLAGQGRGDSVWANGPFISCSFRVWGGPLLVCGPITVVESLVDLSLL